MSAVKVNRDLRAQVGQLLILGFDGTYVSAKLRAMLATLQPGGIILFARNITGPRQAYELLRDSQACLTQRGFLCVDLEGGTVDRLRDVIAPAPSVSDVFATGNRKLFRQHGRILGDEARALGFNTDFAPVFDLRLLPSASVLSSRTASPDPKDATLYARECLRGLRDVGVLGCGKHFPGLGEANLDTHHELPSIAKPWKRLWNEDLYPYRELRREAAFVMVAHAAYPAVTKKSEPASLSRKWITDILRKKIGYKGLIITDDLEMGGVAAAASIEDAAITTLEAGADMFLICHKEEKVWPAYEAVLSKAERDRRFARLIAERARRVAAFKKKSRELKRKVSPPSDKLIDKLRRELWEFSEQVRYSQAAR